MTISEDEKVYGDEELALILRKAAELARLSHAEGDTSSGLSLEEIKTGGDRRDTRPRPRRSPGNVIHDCVFECCCYRAVRVATH